MGSSVHHGGDYGGYGFPSVANCGYVLLPMEDEGSVSRMDPQISGVLGLTIAVHRRTSQKRFCLQLPKDEIPEGVPPEAIQSMVRNLRRCEHANVLQLFEAFEDEEYLMLMYEHFPCWTVHALLETHQWGQEQVANLVRECGAAVAFAHGCGLSHTGLTLHHVMIAAPAAKGGDPMLAKIFGFGLMGCVLTATLDRVCWAPELLEKYKQLKGAANFAAVVDGTFRQACDSWGIGNIAFAVIARRLPFANETAVLRKKWEFSFEIESYDKEAKTLIERLLDAARDQRLTPERIPSHEWIRKFWRRTAEAGTVFNNALAFCKGPLPQRLVGRFLVPFLEADHMRSIARSFYALDARGMGCITIKELEAAARSVDKTLGDAELVMAWLAPHGSMSLSLRAFAQTLAEDVIDGTCLRSAFESLDDDGSEEITVEELFEKLQQFDTTGSMTVEQVREYVTKCEGTAGSDGGDNDLCIDYDEFCKLFPEQAKREQSLLQRTAAHRSASGGLSQQLVENRDGIQVWIQNVSVALEALDQRAQAALANNSQGRTAARDLKEDFDRVHALLKAPPGPATKEDFQQKVAVMRKNINVTAMRQTSSTGPTGKAKAQPKGKAAMHRRSSRASKEETDGFSFGYGSFAQDQGVVEEFPTLVYDEMRKLKAAIINDRAVNQVEAHGAAKDLAMKVRQALARMKFQMMEYESFVDVEATPDDGILGGHNGVSMSGRGLRGRAGDKGDSDDEDGGVGGMSAAAYAHGGGCSGPAWLCSSMAICSTGTQVKAT